MTTTTTKKTVKEVRNDLESAMQEGGHLGDLVNWSIRVGAGVLPEEVEKALTDNELDTSYMPNHPSDLSAVQRVMREFKRQGFVFRKLANDDGHTLWAVASTEVDADAKVGDRAGEVVNQMAFLKPTGEMVFDREDEPTAQAMAGAFSRYKGRYDRDMLRGMVKNFLLGKFNGVKMSSGMGLCFVPTDAVDEVRRLEQAVAMLGESELGVLPVPGTPGAKRTVGNSIREAVESKVEKFRAEMDAWSEDTRPSTIERRMSAYADLRRQANDLRTFLDQTNADLLEDIDGLAKNAKAMLESAVDPDAESRKPKTVRKAKPAAKKAIPAEHATDRPDRLLKADLKRTCKEAGIDTRGMKVKDMREALAAL